MGARVARSWASSILDIPRPAPAPRRDPAHSPLPSTLLFVPRPIYNTSNASSAFAQVKPPSSLSQSSAIISEPSRRDGHYPKTSGVIQEDTVVLIPDVIRNSVELVTHIINQWSEDWLKDASLLRIDEVLNQVQGLETDIKKAFFNALSNSGVLSQMFGIPKLGQRVQDMIMNP